MENLSLDVSGKNSFSVLLTEVFRNISGDKTEKLKNCFLWRISPWISLEKTVFQFFSFSVLLTEVFRNIPHFLVVQCMSYIFIYELDMWPPKRSLPNLEVKMCLKHCKNQCFCEKCRFFWGGATIYIYIHLIFIQVCHALTPFFDSSAWCWIMQIGSRVWLICRY